MFKNQEDVCGLSLDRITVSLVFVRSQSLQIAMELTADVGLWFAVFGLILAGSLSRFEAFFPFAGLAVSGFDHLEGLLDLLVVFDFRSTQFLAERLTVMISLLLAFAVVADSARDFLVLHDAGVRCVK